MTIRYKDDLDLAHRDYYELQRRRLTSVVKTRPPRGTQVYDNGGKTADRYTVVFPWKGDGPGLRQSLGLSSDPDWPQGVSLYGDALPGPHLGRRIRWRNLPDNVRKHVLRRIS